MFLDSRKVHAILILPKIDITLPDFFRCLVPEHVFTDRQTQKCCLTKMLVFTAEDVGERRRSKVRQRTFTGHLQHQRTSK